MAAAVERSFEVEGERLAGLALGEAGPGLLLLHGFGSDRMSWYLNQTEAGLYARTLALDLPGHGASTTRVADLTIETAADTVARVIELFGAPVHVAGHSFGGAVAVALAARHPDLVASLLLVAPAGVGQRVNRDFIAAYVAMQSEDDALAVLQTLVDRPRLISRQMAARVLADVERPGRRAALTAISARMAGLIETLDPLVERVAALPNRRTVLWGENDRVSPPDATRIARLRADVTMLPGVGHLPHMENPALANALLKATVLGS